MNGRPLDAWSDADLAEFARRYNVGWVLARSPEAIRRWHAAGAKEVARYRDGGEVVLFELNRQRSFVLAGSAKWEQADRRKVVLTDIVPADAPHPDGGPVPAKVIVLSLHHQPGLKVSPNIVLVERDPDAARPDPDDPPADDGPAVADRDQLGEPVISCSPLPLGERGRG